MVAVALRTDCSTSALPGLHLGVDALCVQCGLLLVAMVTAGRPELRRIDWRASVPCLGGMASRAIELRVHGLDEDFCHFLGSLGFTQRRRGSEAAWHYPARSHAPGIRLNAADANCNQDQCGTKARQFATEEHGQDSIAAVAIGYGSLRESNYDRRLKSVPGRAVSVIITETVWEELARQSRSGLHSA